LIALDTNILAYAVTSSDPANRHEAAISLLERLANPGAIIPLPVFGEFFNACRKKKLAKPELATSRVQFWLDVFDSPFALADDYVEAAQISTEYGLQYFDALILRVARRAGATILLSEDMQDGLDIDGLRIVNPFVATNETLLGDYFDSAN
jgi:predicted nucleic acid-binding protein